MTNPRPTPDYQEPDPRSNPDYPYPDPRPPAPVLDPRTGAVLEASDPRYPRDLRDPRNIAQPKTPTIADLARAIHLLAQRVPHLGGCGQGRLDDNRQTIPCLCGVQEASDITYAGPVVPAAAYQAASARDEEVERLRLSEEAAATERARVEAEYRTRELARAEQAERTRKQADRDREAAEVVRDKLESKQREDIRHGKK